MAKVGRSNRKHGLWKHPLYNIFMKIKDRCENPACHAFSRYGGRGIAVEFEGPEDFIAWAEASGYVAGLSIDRIDNNGPYSRANCRWADARTQNRNKSSNRMVTIAGVTRCVAEWCEFAGVSQSAFYARARKNMSAEVALGLV